MDMNNILSPTDLAIASFGGVRALARNLGCDPSAVSRWRKTGMIPSSYQRAVLENAWTKGVDITAHDLIFGRANG
jgi:hypothetical protein